MRIAALFSIVLSASLFLLGTPIAEATTVINEPPKPDPAQTVTEQFWNGLKNYSDDKFDLKISVGLIGKPDFHYFVLDTYNKLERPWMNMQDGSRVEFTVQTEKGLSVSALSIEREFGNYRIASSVVAVEEGMLTPAPKVKKKLDTEGVGLKTRKLVNNLKGINSLSISVGRVAMVVPPDMKSKPVPIFNRVTNIQFNQPDITLDMEKFYVRRSEFNGKYESGDMFLQYEAWTKTLIHNLILSESVRYIVQPLPVPISLPSPIFE
ncbi:MAG: hypothetical protein OHK0017_05800 [Patescibacteria group bacterium]